MSWLKNSVGSVLLIAIIALSFIGWVRSLVKFIGSDFQAPYKSEIIYGLGTATGLGSVIGWINIED